ncbi:DEAD/DEAH box helicase family protein [Streptococcus parauberis]|uniref:DNA helicase, phage-associated n=1 Tax=Streptococcus parauberis KRS-02083 TaxID=1207545 RepID=A0ABN0ISB3_9STRE|nr:SNF2-related protein [Streptococcus parauberis]EMG25755.1 DNA helicase, phage-associated [Streptococcus parauberis KRS-02083]QBX27479.1 DNA helicase [Streptococcus phage Javan392]WOF46156.1 DEAD/DEAH box helicase family protein [Streptococcus parauberis]
MKLHEYQEYAKTWIVEHSHCGLLLDMGLGKTLTTLAAIDEIENIFCEGNKILIIAPKKVADETWSAEIEKWGFEFTYSKVLGSTKKRLEALEKEADIYIINRENVVWLVEYYKTKWPFTFVVIDELSSFKSSKSKRFRALRKVRPKIKRFVGLTGTPAPNSLIDLWPQIYLMDGGKRLETSQTKFKDRYFRPDKQNGPIVYSWALRPNAEEEIYQKIDDICISMKAKDFLKLPPRTDNIVTIKLSDMRAYKQFEKDLVLELEDQEVTASNSAVLANKLLQMANGAIYDDEKNVISIHDDKLEALEDIIEDSQGQPILVFYQYKHDLERLKKKFPQAEELTTVDKWNSGKIPMLLCHPQSAGHGLNLQKGGHIIVWFGLTWSLEYYQQANARLDRQGQTEPVIIHHLVAEGTVDEKVLSILQGKEKNQNALLEAVKAQLTGV